MEAKERVRTCKDHVVSREVITVLKIAVESVTLDLCDSRDYFASSLHVKNPISHVNLFVTLKKEAVVYSLGITTTTTTTATTTNLYLISNLK